MAERGSHRHRSWRSGALVGTAASLIVLAGCTVGSGGDADAACPAPSPAPAAETALMPAGLSFDKIGTVTHVLSTEGHLTVQAVTTKPIDEVTVLIQDAVTAAGYRPAGMDNEGFEAEVFFTSGSYAAGQALVRRAECEGQWNIDLVLLDPDIVPSPTPLRSATYGNQADADAKLRFELLLMDDGNTPVGHRYRSGPREWDYETWTDDLGRAAGCLARQDFKFAASLVDRWLRRFDPHGLDHQGLYLHARSLVLLGDLQRDQGAIQGPLSARQTYRRALDLFGRLGVPRRAAQVELSLAVVDEMSGQLEPAAVRYVALAEDERLAMRDRSRARLWIGTALSKEGKNDYAVQVMATATREFEDLEEPDDWSVAHQKVALAYRGAGDLNNALRYIDVALTNRSSDSPMQRVRLDTAHAHILLSDPMTAENGLAILSQAARVSTEYGLSHQLRSIEGIRYAFERQAQSPPRSIHLVISPPQRVTEQHWQDAQLIWDYHEVGHELSRCDAAIGLGSHDLGVAAYAVELYQAGLFPVLVFSGANSPTTAKRFPRGEAAHYREHAIDLGVPDIANLVEPQASNTGQNITLSRALLADHGHTPRSVLLISKPYMERRAYATCRKVWPEADVVCTSEPLKFDDYVQSIGDEKLVIDMLVGDLQRVIEYPKLGYAIEQNVPLAVLAAYDRLLAAGFDSRILKQ